MIAGRKENYCSSGRVRRQGLEPRTRGLRVDCLAAPGALPAQIPHANAQKAPIARRCGRCSSHESSHGSQSGPGGSVTVSDGGCAGRTRAEPPICIFGGRDRLMVVAAQIGHSAVLACRRGSYFCAVRQGVGQWLLWQWGSRCRSRPAAWCKWSLPCSGQRAGADYAVSRAGVATSLGSAGGVLSRAMEPSDR
jgi:hypothetical protein